MGKIIVTGGAGYIGSHTVVELVNAGHIPIIIDNLSNTSAKNIDGIEKITGKKIEWYKIDCTNKNAIAKIFAKEEIKGIIHFAAYKSIKESVKYPEKYYKNNIGSLETILECMNDKNINNIIFSSSCTVYGSPDILPVDEHAKFKQAESPYAETKQLCENILKKDPCNSIALRYFNPIGSHKSILIGDCSNDNEKNLVPIIAEVATGKRKEITIFGDDYRTPDGTCVRDYIHVVDLAISHVNALDYLLRKNGKYTFNIGTGIGVSVLDAITTFEKSNNIKINYSIGERRNGDIEKIWSNCNLANKELNWIAKRSIEESMIDALNWEKSKEKDVI